MAKGSDLADGEGKGIYNAGATSVKDSEGHHQTALYARQKTATILLLSVQMATAEHGGLLAKSQSGVKSAASLQGCFRVQALGVRTSESSITYCHDNKSRIPECIIMGSLRAVITEAALQQT